MVSIITFSDNNILLYSEAILSVRGHVHMTSAKFSGFLTPSPLVCILDQFIVLNSCNLPYYICFWSTPSPPSAADIICTCPLREMSVLKSSLILNS